MLRGSLCEKELGWLGFYQSIVPRKDGSGQVFATSFCGGNLGKEVDSPSVDFKRWSIRI